jgi:hypothetical protein
MLSPIIFAAYKIREELRVGEGKRSTSEALSANGLGRVGKNPERDFEQKIIRLELLLLLFQDKRRRNTPLTPLKRGTAAQHI